MSTAFAVFCQNTGSLDFYKRDTVPTAGSEYNGKLVSNVYTGFETATYSYQGTPWNEVISSVTSITFVDVITPTRLDYWFAKAVNLVTCDVANLDVSNVRYMKDMFHYCESLQRIDFSSWNTDLILGANSFLSGCKSLTNETIIMPDGFCSNATNITSFFSGCDGLTYISLPDGFGTSATGVGSLFSACINLTDVQFPENFGTKADNLTYMFSGCTSLVSIELPDGLGVVAINTSGIFSGCQSLQNVQFPDNFGAESTNMSTMFFGCSSLVEIDLSNVNTGKVKNMDQMFYSCSSLTTVYASKLWDTSSVTSSDNMFWLCRNIAGDGGVVYNSNNIDITSAINAVDGAGYLTYRRYIEPMYREDMLINGVTVLDIADAVRSVTGTEDEMNPIEMSSNLNDFRSNMDGAITDQSSIIAQIQTALEGKASVSASGEVSITENGVHDVKQYATANVNVQSEPALLWTNASPTSAFAAQTVTLATGYDAYLVESKWRTTAHISGSTGINSIDFVKVGQKQVAIVPLAYASNTVYGYREFTANANSIVFGDGALVSSSSDNNFAIPLRIWGVKFTL